MGGSPGIHMQERIWGRTAGFQHVAAQLPQTMPKGFLSSLKGGTQKHLPILEKTFGISQRTQMCEEGEGCAKPGLVTSP